MIVPIIEAYAFDWPISTDSAAVRAALLKFVFAIALFFVLRWALKWTAQVVRKDPRHVRWARGSAGYLLAMAVLLMLTYPGAWQWDETGVLAAAKAYDSFGWQHYLNVVFYTFSLYIFTSPIAVVIVQLVFASLAIGFVVSEVAERIHRPALAYLALVPFVTLPVLSENPHPLPLTAYSYVVLLLVFVTLLPRQRQANGSVRFTTVLGCIVLVTVASFWRTEGVVFLVLLPLVLAQTRCLHAGASSGNTSCRDRAHRCCDAGKRCSDHPSDLGQPLHNHRLPQPAFGHARGGPARRSSPRR